MDAPPLMAQTARELDEALHVAVTELHDVQGYSWTEIAGRMGITRQAARQRFS